MTRSMDNRQSAAERAVRNGAAGVPSFLRAQPEDRPDPTDLDLHIHESAASIKAVETPAPAAPAAPVAPGATTQQWGNYQAVSASTPKPDDYAIQPGSYLAAAEALPPSSEMSPEDVEHAQAREWDPLTDPWPLGNRPGMSVEATLLERAAQERVAPYGLMAYEPGGFNLPPVPKFGEQAAGYSPVVFSPAPYEDADDPALMTQPYDIQLEHPSGPLPRHGTWPPAGPVPDSPAGLTRREPTFTMPKPVPDSAYDVTLTGTLGTVDLGFAGGRWYSLAGDEARPVSVGDAVWAHPELAGQIVQVACWWMRENPKAERAVDLATEIAMAVTDAVRGNRVF